MIIWVVFNVPHQNFVSKTLFSSKNLHVQVTVEAIYLRISGSRPKCLQLTLKIEKLLEAGHPLPKAQKDII